MSTAIEITAGINEWTSRLSLKKIMENFGEVVGCHIGNRGVDKPVVRFQTPASAEAALESLRSGRVLLDGLVLRGDWKGATAAREGTSDSRRAGPRLEEIAEPTSRDFLSRDFRNGGRKPRSQSRSFGGSRAYGRPGGDHRDRGDRKSVV